MWLICLFSLHILNTSHRCTLCTTSSPRRSSRGRSLASWRRAGPRRKRRRNPRKKKVTFNIFTFMFLQECLFLTVRRREMKMKMLIKHLRIVVWIAYYLLLTVKKAPVEESDLPEVDQNTNKTLRQRQSAAKAKWGRAPRARVPPSHWVFPLHLSFFLRSSFPSRFGVIAQMYSAHTRPVCQHL